MSCSRAGIGNQPASVGRIQQSQMYNNDPNIDLGTNNTTLLSEVCTKLDEE